MDQNEMAGKKPKKRSRGGIVLLVILLILAGGVGFLYYSVVKAPLDLDDPQQMAASAPMSAGERFRFYPADQTVQVKLDAADIWSLVIAQAGPDFLDTINKELSAYSLTLSGCGIRMEEESLRLDLELFYEDIRLVAKVPCTLEVSGRNVSLQPTGVKLGVISLPVAKLLSSVKLEYALDLPVINDMQQVSFVQDALLITGSMVEDFSALVPVSKKLSHIALFFENLQPLADALQNQEDYAALLSRLEQNPGSVEEVYHNLFVMAAPEKTTAYLDKRYGMTERFFPGIDFSGLEAEQTALTEQVTPLSLDLERFLTMVVGDYNDKKFKLSDGEFLLKKKPFVAGEYGVGKSDALFEVLDPESFFLVLVDAEDGFIRSTSSFYRMAAENLEFTQPVDYNKTYILGCVFRRAGGDPFLMYESEVENETSYVRVMKLVPLTEEEVNALQVPGKFGVWTG